MLFTIPRVGIRLLPFAAGSILGTSLLLRRQRLIANDFFSKPKKGESLAKYGEPLKGHGLSRFNGALDYGQLTFGSFLGMVGGYVFGKISKILVGIIVTSLLTTEYLAATGHIDLRPVYSKIYHWCYDHFHQEIFVNDPSFKYSFTLAFLIATFNS